MKMVWVYRRHPGEELLAQTHDFDVRPANYPVFAEFDTMQECGAFESTITGDELERLYRFQEPREIGHRLVKPADWLENGVPEAIRKLEEPKPVRDVPAVIHNFKRAAASDNDPNNWTPREALLSALNEINEHGYDRAVVILGKIDAEDGSLTTAVKQATKNTLEGYGLLVAAQDLLVTKD